MTSAWRMAALVGEESNGAEHHPELQRLSRAIGSRSTDRSRHTGEHGLFSRPGPRCSHIRGNGMPLLPDRGLSHNQVHTITESNQARILRLMREGCAVTDERVRAPCIRIFAHHLVHQRELVKRPEFLRVWQWLPSSRLPARTRFPLHRQYPSHR